MYILPILDFPADQKNIRGSVECDVPQSVAGADEVVHFPMTVFSSPRRLRGAPWNGSPPGAAGNVLAQKEARTPPVPPSGPGTRGKNSLICPWSLRLFLRAGPVLALKAYPWKAQKGLWAS